MKWTLFLKSMAGLALVVSALFPPVATSEAATPSEPAGRSTIAETRLQALEERHLDAQIQELEDEHGIPFWERPSLVGVLGAVAALGGLLWTITQQRREMARQRVADRQSAKQDQQMRLDNLFARLATDISSQDRAVRLSATAGIESFASLERRAYHRQLLSLLQGMVKLSRGDVTDRVIARAFVRFLSLQQSRGQAPDGPLDLEMACLSGCSLKNLDLRGADLRASTMREVTIDPTVDFTGANCQRLSAQRLSAPGAELKEIRLEAAVLQEADLKGADLGKAKLQKANLISANLRGANLRDARLRGARLQSAHFEGADLCGARFDDSDLRDAYFESAKLDPPAIRSILRSSHWEDAHWDAIQLQKLQEG